MRQDYYGHRFGDGSYTPEMVVDGMVGLVARTAAKLVLQLNMRSGGRTPATDVVTSDNGGSI